MDTITNLLNQIQNFVRQNQMMIGAVVLICLIYFFCLKPKMNGFAAGGTLITDEEKREKL